MSGLEKMDAIRWRCYGCEYVRPSDELGSDGLPKKVACLFNLEPYRVKKCPRRVNSFWYNEELAEEAFYNKLRAEA